MNFKRTLSLIAAALLLSTLSVRAQDAASPATTGAAAEAAKRSVDKKGLGLSGAQERLIRESIRDEKPQAPADLAIGKPVPDSMMLIEMPVEVKDQIGVLRDFKFARLQDNTIVLVDPASRVVVEVIGN